MTNEHIVVYVDLSKVPNFVTSDMNSKIGKAKNTSNVTSAKIITMSSKPVLIVITLFVTSALIISEEWSSK